VQLDFRGLVELQVSRDYVVHLARQVLLVQ